MPALYLSLDSLVPGPLLRKVPTWLVGYRTFSSVLVPADTATVTVFEQGADPTSATPVDVFPNPDGTGTPLAQPLTPDEDGHLPGFVGQPAGLDIHVSGRGITSRVLTVGYNSFLASVPSVNGHTGPVVLGADDVGAIAKSIGTTDGDMAIFTGGSWVRAPKGSTGSWLLVRSDGTVSSTQPPTVNARVYGIKADGQEGNIARVTAGDNHFTVATGTFSDADRGKLVCIAAVGANRRPAVGRISSWAAGSPNDTLQMTDLITGATVVFSYGNGTLRRMWWASDDTTTLQTMINANPRGVVELPAGDIGTADTIDFNSVSFAGTGGGFAFTLRGVGGGRDSVGRTATRIVSFGPNEALLSSANNVLGLHVERLGIKCLQGIGRSDSTGEEGLDVGAVFLTNQYGSGHWEDIRIDGPGNLAQTLAGNVTIGSNVITGLPVPVLTNFAANSAPKIGDWLFGNGIPANTRIYAINETSGTITMRDSTLTNPANGTVTAATTIKWLPRNAGHGLWIDNPATGQQKFERFDIVSFDSIPSGSFAGSDAIRFGSLQYGLAGGGSAVNITATATNGSNVLTGISAFAGWWPGAIVTDTANAHGLNGAQVRRVDRARGTATLSVAASASGSATFGMGANGANSGNMQFDACNANGCQNGVHGYYGGLTNNCTFSTFKSTAAAAPAGSANRKTKGVWFETNHSTHTLISPHCESSYYAYHFNGCDTMTLVSPIVGSRTGTAGDGSTGFYFDRYTLTGTQAMANRIIRGRMGAGYDNGVVFADTSHDNELEVFWPTGQSPLTQKYVTNGRNRVVDISSTSPYRSRLVRAHPGYMMGNVAPAAPVANRMYFTRAKSDATGLLKLLTALVNTTAAGAHLWFAVYDCGDTTAGKYTRLWDSGSQAIVGTGVWQSTMDPLVQVLEDQQLMLGWMTDNTAVRMAMCAATLGGTGSTGQLPTGYLPNPGGALEKVAAIFDVGSFAQPPATIDEANMVANTQIFNVLAQAT